MVVCAPSIKPSDSNMMSPELSPASSSVSSDSNFKKKPRKISQIGF